MLGDPQTAFAGRGVLKIAEETSRWLQSNARADSGLKRPAEVLQVARGPVALEFVVLGCKFGQLATEASSWVGIVLQKEIGLRY